MPFSNASNSVCDKLICMTTLCVGTKLQELIGLMQNVLAKHEGILKKNFKVDFFSKRASYLQNKSLGAV
jgi:hypothetical protein